MTPYRTPAIILVKPSPPTSSWEKLRVYFHHLRRKTLLSAYKGTEWYKLKKEHWIFTRINKFWWLPFRDPTSEWEKLRQSEENQQIYYRKLREYTNNTKPVDGVETLFFSQNGTFEFEKTLMNDWNMLAGDYKHPELKKAREDLDKTMASLQKQRIKRLHRS